MSFWTTTFVFWSIYRPLIGYIYFLFIFYFHAARRLHGMLMLPKVLLTACNGNSVGLATG